MSTSKTGPNTPRKLPRGSRVVIKRDEEKYPPTRLWRDWRGKKGTVIEHNLGEIGVDLDDGSPTLWFYPYEVERLK